MIFANSTAAVFFAAVSMVSAGCLVFVSFSQERKKNPPNAMANFHRHLSALSDESREQLRSDLRAAKDRQTRR